MPKREYICTNCSGPVLRYQSTVRNEETVFCSVKCQAEWQEVALLGEANPNFKTGNYCLPSYCECGREKYFRSIRCAICARRGFSRSGETLKPGLALLKATVMASQSFLEVAKRLEVSRQTVTRMVKGEKVDYSHFRPRRRRVIVSKDALIKDSPVTSGTIRRIVIRENLLPHRCIECGQGPEWKGSPLTLQLDHINGDRKDNRLENLRWLCPNCHSQTPTWTGRNSRGTRKGVTR